LEFWCFRSWSSCLISHPCHSFLCFLTQLFLFMSWLIAPTTWPHVISLFKLMRLVNRKTIGS
jgi:hypothetical protein